MAAQVLIVEDDLDHAEVMADALRKPGHVCTIVNSVAFMRTEDFAGPRCCKNAEFQCERCCR